MRRVARDPKAAMTRNRAELLRGLRSYHIRYAQAAADLNVKRPVHVLFYRAVRPGLIEIVRVLHERMEPSRHIEDVAEN